MCKLIAITAAALVVGFAFSHLPDRHAGEPHDRMSCAFNYRFDLRAILAAGGSCRAVQSHFEEKTKGLSGLSFRQVDHLADELRDACPDGTVHKQMTCGPAAGGKR